MVHFSDAELEGVISLPEAIDALASAFAAWGTGNAVVQPRVATISGDFRINTMAAALPGIGYSGAKVYTALGNRFSFVFLLFSMTDGRILATFDMAHLTQLRTAAVTALAARYLARRGSATLAVFGTGTQAAGHITALTQVLPIRNVHVVSRGDAASFIERMRRESKACVEQRKAEEAVKTADVIVTATRSRVPLFDGRFVKEGTFIAAVGSAVPGAAELDSLCVSRCDRVVVEALDHAQHEAGDLVQAEKAGAFSWDRATLLSDLVLSRAKGRETDSGIALFKSVGCAIEDVAIAAIAYQGLRARPSSR